MPERRFDASAVLIGVRSGTVSQRSGWLALGLLSAKPGLGFGGLVEAVQGRQSCVGKFHGSQYSEARAAQDRDREIPEQVGGGGHACLRKHDDVDVVGEATDVHGDALKVAGVVAGIE